jgi:hypothetical protein
MFVNDVAALKGATLPPTHRLEVCRCRWHAVCCPCIVIDVAQVFTDVPLAIELTDALIASLVQGFFPGVWRGAEAEACRR